eukprot:16433779-Heterocapsa_arctica.AAC.1
MRLLGASQSATGPATARESDRVHVPPLPTHADYGAWRYTLLANVLGASGKPTQTANYLREINDPMVSDDALAYSLDPAL